MKEKTMEIIKEKSEIVFKYIDAEIEPPTKQEFWDNDVDILELWLEITKLLQKNGVPEYVKVLTYAELFEFRLICEVIAGIKEADIFIKNKHMREEFKEQIEKKMRIWKI